MRKNDFFEKNHFSKKRNFSKKKLFLIFLLSQSQVYGYPRDPLAIVVAWVPITGVYNQFLHASGQIKKKNGKILPFSNFVFLPKMRQNAQFFFCVSGPLGNVKTYLDTKFQLIWPSNEARASKRSLLKKKVYYFDFLGYLKAK